MKFLSILAASILATTAVASERQRYRRWPQTNTGGSTGSTTGGSTPNNMVKVIVVKVGNEAGGLVFEPNDIRANPGDMVQFQFYPKNHSVAMSNFAQPCIPIEQSTPNATFKFYSGFMPTTNMGQLTYTIRVPDTKPIWFYCSQGRHCQSGMVGAINSPATGNTLSNFVQTASRAQQNLSPGQVTGGSSSTNGGAGTGTTSGAEGFSTPGASTPGLPQATGNSADSLTRPSILGSGLIAVFAWLLL